MYVESVLRENESKHAIFSLVLT